jgi:hypothetical protein
VDYNVLCGIRDDLEYLVGIVALNKRACRADYGALAAAYASYVVEILLERAADNGVEAAVVRADNGYILLLASRYAATAENALVVVANEVQSGVILLVVSLLALKLCLVNAVLKAELLELAGVASRAGEALLVVVREQKLEVGLSVFLNLGCVGKDFGTLSVDGIYACGNKAARALYLAETHTAGADFVDFLKVAKSRDLDTELMAGFKDGGIFLDLIVFTVDFNVQHFHVHISFP